MDDFLNIAVLRSHSFDDREFLDPNNTLSREHMKTDVDICIQCLIMHRRRIHIEATIVLLQVCLRLTPHLATVTKCANPLSKGAYAKQLLE